MGKFKLLVAAAVLAAASLPAFAGENDITVRKIRLVVDDRVVYEWTNANSVPPKDPGDPGVTWPVTVASFLDFRPGDRMTPAQLERKAAVSQGSLIASGFFYSVQVLVVPPQSFPEYRTVVIRVTEGFLYRFGGGNAYGMFGKQNLNGLRRSFKLYAGANIAGGEYRDGLLFGGRFTGRVALYYKNSIGHGSSCGFYHDPEAAASLEYRFDPVWSLTLESKVRYYFFEDASYPDRGDFIPSLSLTAGYAESDSPLSSGAKFILKSQLYVPLEGGQIQSKTFAAVSANLSILKRLTANLELGGGWETPGVYAPDRFDLASTEDHSIRSGWPVAELTGDSYAFSSFELRFGIVAFKLPPFFNTSIDGFLYTDQGFVAPSGGTLFGTELKDAYGAGLRLSFNNPVFVYFTFAYGVNRDGDGRFTFTGTKGF